MDTAIYCRGNPNQLRVLCQKIFEKTGLSSENAATVTDNLLFADLRGISTHGITRIKSYCERAARGCYNVAPKLKVLHETQGTFSIDGDNGFGAVVGEAAMKLAIEKAHKTGVGFGTACHSNHFGAASYYTLMAAKEDMIGVCCTNSPPNMAPYGSREPMLGTNPFSVAAPAGNGSPMVLDIATSVVARGNILNAAKNDEPIPDGWAVDHWGVPTNDPQAALRGAVLPFGGHKGSGMAVMIDVLSGVLSGAAFGRHITSLAAGETDGAPPFGSGIGHMFFVVDISALRNTSLFRKQIDQMIAELKHAQKAPGVDEILYPGELEQRRQAENLRLGIPLSLGVYHELTELSDSMGLGECFRACF